MLFTRAISLWATGTVPSNDLAKAFHNLGAVYRAEGRYVDAARFYLRALDLRESLAGPRDVSLLPILNELGLVYLEMADYVEAEKTLQRAIAIVQEHQAEETVDGRPMEMNNLDADRSSSRERLEPTLQHVVSGGRWRDDAPSIAGTSGRVRSR